MFHKYTVKIPDIAKIRMIERSGAFYIQYEYDRVYNPKKKYNYPKSAVIGKLCEYDSSLMYPNENFLRYFPDDRRAVLENRDGVNYLIVHEIPMDKSLLDKLEYAINNNREPSLNAKENIEKYNRIGVALNEVFKNRDISLDSVDERYYYIVPKPIVEVVFDERTESLIKKAFEISDQLAKTVFSQVSGANSVRDHLI